MIYGGAIKDAYLLTITDLDDAMFVYGTIVYDTSGRFKAGDWIATSNLYEIREVKDGFAAITQNCIYFIEGYNSLDIPWQAVENIRTGTNPVLALKLIEGTKEINVG
jgi:hypothetical protein